MPEDINDNIINMRYFGDYELNVKINTEKFQIYDMVDAKEPTNGVGSITYEIKYKEEKKFEKPIETKEKI